jgi:hypothetical protein
MQLPRTFKNLSKECWNIKKRHILAGLIPQALIRLVAELKDGKIIKETEATSVIETEEVKAAKKWAERLVSAAMNTFLNEIREIWGQRNDEKAKIYPEKKWNRWSNTFMDEQQIDADAVPPDPEPPEEDSEDEEEETNEREENRRIIFGRQEQTARPPDERITTAVNRLNRRLRGVLEPIPALQAPLPELEGAEQEQEGPEEELAEQEPVPRRPRQTLQNKAYQRTESRTWEETNEMLAEIFNGSPLIFNHLLNPRSTQTSSFKKYRSYNGSRRRAPAVRE